VGLPSISWVYLILRQSMSSLMSKKTTGPRRRSGKTLRPFRRLFDFLVTGQVLLPNPAEPVRSPKLNIEGGKNPTLTAEEARELLDSTVAEKKELLQLWDRAIIDVMTYTFTRVSATVGHDVGGLLPSRTPMEKLSP